jgi:hypothetical protein
MYIRKSGIYCIYYVGKWSANKKTGKGACYDDTGVLNYYGEFVDGDLTGNSSPDHDDYKFDIINYSSGDKYIGETIEGKANGYGIYLWSDGDMWYGQWKDNKCAGYGIFVTYNAEIITGIWDGDSYTKIE